MDNTVPSNEQFKLGEYRRLDLSHQNEVYLYFPNTMYATHDLSCLNSFNSLHNRTCSRPGNELC